MKKEKSSFLQSMKFLILLLSIMISACSGGNREQIIGTWKIVSTEPSDMMVFMENTYLVFDEKYMCVARPDTTTEGKYQDTDIFLYTWKSGNVMVTTDRYMNGQYLREEKNRKIKIREINDEKMVIEWFDAVVTLERISSEKPDILEMDRNTN